PPGPGEVYGLATRGGNVATVDAGQASAAEPAMMPVSRDRVELQQAGYDPLHGHPQLLRVAVGVPDDADGQARDQCMHRDAADPQLELRGPRPLRPGDRFQPDGEIVSADPVGAAQRLGNLGVAA